MGQRVYILVQLDIEGNETYSGIFFSVEKAKDYIRKYNKIVNEKTFKVVCENGIGYEIYPSVLYD